MLTLVSEIPEYCPKCGRFLEIEERASFLNGQSVICQCGTGLQYMALDAALEAAEEAGGDLQYMDLSLDVPCNSEELDSYLR